MSKTVETPLAVVDVDLKKSLKVIDQIKHKVGDLAIRIAANLVKTKEDYDKAIVLGKEANDAIKDVKNAVEKETREADAFSKKVKANGKAVITSIEEPQDGLRGRCAVFLAKEIEKRNKELAKIAEQQKRVEEAALSAPTTVQQEKLLAKADKLDDKIVAIETNVPDSQVMERRFKITDESLVPRQYLVIDEKALRTAGGGVKEPIRTDIPGVEFYDAPKVAFR